jgi:hypothetical protein
MAEPELIDVAQGLWLKDRITSYRLPPEAEATKVE